MESVKKNKELKPAGSVKNFNKKELQETYPMVGGAGQEDYGWNILSKDVDRDLDPLMQSRMQDIAFYLYDANPLAHRIIEMTKDFIVGEGFTFKAEDPAVQEVLEKHWEDPINNWDVKQDDKAKDLGLYGEQFYPVFVNKHNGRVRLGYLDPTRIEKIIKDKKNPEILRTIILKKDKKGDIKKYKVINPNNNGKLEGEIFAFAINKVSNAVRGRSDLLCLADWIDGYDQFLFARLERANILNNYVWDVCLEGANDETIREWLKEQALPKPGSIRAHNEKVKWEAASPELEAADASKEANLFKMQILGGAGFPNLWFGEGGETIRAGSDEMSLPTLKHLQKRQMYFKFLLKYIFTFVIDKAIEAGGVLKEDVNTKFKIFAAPLVKKRSAQLGIAAGRVTDSLAQAQEKEWITKEEAALAYKTFMKDVIGIDFGGITEKEKEPNEKPEVNDETS